MIDILTHYFRTGRPPFLSLSALAEEEALEIMNELYVDNEMWGRFRNPMAYLTERKKCEQWLKNAFISKGGIPKQNYPIYMVLGTCPEIEKNEERWNK